MIRFIHLGPLAILLASALGLSDTLASDENPLPVETAAAVPQTQLEPLWVPGTIVSRQNANVAPQISGRLDWLVEVGDDVKAGEPIARISDAAWRIQLRSDEAEIRRLAANVEYLQRQVNRFVTLADTNSTAASEVDRLTMELRMLEQERVAAAARRDRTLHDLELATLTAPFAGVIVERSAEVGEFARAGEPVLRIVNTTALEVVARAPINVARHVGPGDVVSLQRDEVDLKSSVRALVPAGDERSRGVEVRLELPAGEWVVGEAVRVALNSGPKAARVAIPRDALVLRDETVYVFKVLDNATAKRIPVRVGKGASELVSVEGDLGAGDQVVIRGAENLKDGQTVRVLSGRAVARGRYSFYEKG